MTESYRICASCGKEFPPYRKQRFCSKQCFGDSLKKFADCAHCGKRFNAVEKNQKYCSTDCYHAAATGENHPRFKGGRIDHEGYLIISVDGKAVRAHRHIMEQSLGRKLLPTEHVHHINEIKTDNRLENLEVVANTEHAQRHVKYFRDEHSKECARCREIKPRSEFYPAKGRRDPNGPQCKACSQLSVREYQEKAMTRQSGSPG